MKVFRSLLACAALAAGLALCAGTAGCGTGLGGSAPAASDAAASTPAVSHYKADLAIGYGLLATAEIGVKNALQAGVVSKAQASALYDQRATFKATLDTLRGEAASAANQTVLTATIAGIRAAIAIVQATQGVPKS